MWECGKRDLFKAIDVIERYLPKFYQKLAFANNSIYLHNNPKVLNFTSIETLGMLYFYVIGSDNIIYFIEELIHQGSHNYLYYIVHDRQEYFQVDVDNLMMKDFTKEEWDYRTIYGAFHGLYTVNQRLVCFDELISKNVFSKREKHELLGRFADQFLRFKTGLEKLNTKDIYTEKGEKLYFTLSSECNKIFNKYSLLKNEFDMSNIDLDFRYDDFCKLNSYEEFLIKDDNNFYNF
ncbi:hypothetical protein G1L02_08535 [Tenacibaculum finnmarkense]|uniref:hypothetical protein n=1 Tax=Tenacibaculum finnmarkense TaxID=2781243 RepID=UPI001EFB6ADE|nr:hypothetical protein [Tenacibaculum finnmarkense]MCG8883203.1 hypothetical protein [Tenacibaculum finnmarkense]